MSDEKISMIEEYIPHTVREVICVRCGGGRAISCHPDTTKLKDLECGSCGDVGGVIATGQYLD